MTSPLRQPRPQSKNRLAIWDVVAEKTAEARRAEWILLGNLGEEERGLGGLEAKCVGPAYVRCEIK